MSLVDEDIDKEDFPYGVPTIELEEPINNQPMLSAEQLLSEKDKNRSEKKYFSAFYLIIGCLIGLGCVYLTNVIVDGIFDKDIAEITESIIEIIKTLVFTLSGYLFAERGKKE